MTHDDTTYIIIMISTDDIDTLFRIYPIFSVPDLSE